MGRTDDRSIRNEARSGGNVRSSSPGVASSISDECLGDGQLGVLLGHARALPERAAQRNDLRNQNPAERSEKETHPSFPLSRRQRGSGGEDQRTSGRDRRGTLRRERGTRRSNVRDSAR